MLEKHLQSDLKSVKKYGAPRLISYGRLSELTQSTNNPGGEPDATTRIDATRGTGLLSDPEF